MPMIAINGRWRFVGLKAAMMASVSSFEIAAAAPASIAGGKERVQPAPIAKSNAAAPKSACNVSLLFTDNRPLTGIKVVSTTAGRSYRSYHRDPAGWAPCFQTLGKPTGLKNMSPVAKLPLGPCCIGILLTFCAIFVPMIRCWERYAKA
jgi:hypothetical protein